jgi:ABC-type sugar transport system ATPase subunit
MGQDIFEMIDIHKSFGGVKALRGVDFRIGESEIMGLLGENGAGKSTLMKVLTGVHQPDSGEIRCRGNPTRIHSTQTAHALGISTIFQEFNLCPNLSALENLYLGNESTRYGLFVDHRKQKRKALELFSMFNVDVDPEVHVGDLGVAHQQLVEIAKSLTFDPCLLIMDEPTASLSRKEVQNLFAIMRDLKAKGISIVFISHKLEEVLEVTDRVVVLRDGNNAGETPTAMASRQMLISMMVGRVLENLYTERKKAPGKEVVFEVSEVSGPPNRKKVSFALHRGEILGLAGLVGAGRTELARLLIGAERRTSGTIRVRGKRIRIDSPVDAVGNGIAYLPEDRKTFGLILGMTTRDNLTLGIHRKVAAAGGFISRRKEEQVSDRFIDELHIKVENREQKAENLSGGNQQKVVIGKWLATEPQVLILDEPTRGIDVGAKAEVHRIISELADNGVGILLISSEMPEVLHLSDRILVMHEGTVTAELSREEATQELIMEAAVADTRAFPGSGSGSK